MSAAATDKHPCGRCGHVAARKWRRCPRCLAWAPEEHAGVDADLARTRDASPMAQLSVAPMPISRVEAAALPLRSTGLPELDRVLGQSGSACGVAPGQVIALGGEPGIGKSTLLLQAIAGLCAHGGRVLYASGEETREQVAARARRLDLHDVLERIDVLATHELETIERALSEGAYFAAVIDSMQAVGAADVGDLGGVRQVKAIAERVTRAAKERGLVAWLVGQATKDGRLAGPLAAAHVVDTVMWFEADETGGYRTVRATKNRFGPIGELAVLEMRAAGLVEVADPAALFVGPRADRPRPAGAAWGIVAEHARPLVLEGLALVHHREGDAPTTRLASGIDAKRLALLLAILERRGGLEVQGDVYLDLRTGVRVTERALDLPLSLAVASAARAVPLPAGLVSCGEVALTGEVRAVSRLQARVAEAARLGFTHAFVPAEQLGAVDSSALPSISIEAIESIADALSILEGAA